MLLPEDIDRLEEHPGFIALSRRIEEMIEQAKTDLTTDIREEATWKARGAVKVMQAIQRLPSVLREEAEKEQAKREPRRSDR